MAHAELDWWQARREHALPVDHGRTIAGAAALVYRVDSPSVREFGALRAAAKAYRDTHGAAMTDADWRAVRDMLRVAYVALKTGVAAR